MPRGIYNRKNKLTNVSAMTAVARNFSDTVDQIQTLMIDDPGKFKDALNTSIQEAENLVNCKKDEIERMEISIKKMKAISELL